MSLGAAPYNPYNTSFATIAMQGLGMAQENMRAGELMAAQTTKSITDSFAFAADSIQRAQDNQARTREADRMDRADDFKEMAFGKEFAFKEGRARAEDAQWEAGFGLSVRQENRMDKDLSFREKTFDENKRQFDQNFEESRRQFNLGRRDGLVTTPQDKLAAAQAAGQEIANEANRAFVTANPGVQLGSAGKSRASSSATTFGMVEMAKKDMEASYDQLKSARNILLGAGVPQSSVEAKQSPDGDRSPINSNYGSNGGPKGGRASGEGSKSMDGALDPEDKPKDYTMAANAIKDLEKRIATAAALIAAEESGDKVSSKKYSSMLFKLDNPFGTAPPPTTSDPRATGSRE